MKSQFYLGMLAATALVATPALAAGIKHPTPKHATTEDGALSAQTKNFIKKADIGGRFEIDSSKIALDRSQTPKVRSFAKTMIDDHTESAENLQSSLPKNAPAIGSGYDHKHAAMLSDLKSTPAAKFDNLYIADQKAAHDEAVALFSNYSAKGDDKELKEFATSTLPTLKEHREHLAGFKKLGANYQATTAGYAAPAAPHHYHSTISSPITDSPNPAVAIVGKREDSPSVLLRR